ncbi:MAG: maltokinase N-terminal cap-like domain-containing protein, partial [Terriglobia bacterium]
MKDKPLADMLQRRLPKVLPDFLRAQRWFAGKAQVIRSVSVSEVVPAGAEGLAVYLVMVHVSYSSGQDHHYALALHVSPFRQEGHEPINAGPSFALEAEEPRYMVYDALHDPAFARLLMERIRRGDTLAGTSGEIIATPGRALDSLWNSGQDVPEPSVMKGEQSNTSVRYGAQFILKFNRRIEEGVNLDLEMGSFLTEKARFKYTAPLAGSIEYRRAGRPPATLGILQGYVQNQGDAWQYTLQSVSHFLDAAASRPATEVKSARRSLPQLLDAPAPVPPWAEPSLSAYLESTQLLGKRTAELHLALVSDPNDPNFAPENFSSAYRRSVSDSMIHLADENLRLLSSRVDTLPSSTRDRARTVLARREQIMSRFRSLKEAEISTRRTRLHG